jgi:hypothetical protein
MFMHEGPIDRLFRSQCSACSHLKPPLASAKRYRHAKNQWQLL